MANHLRGEAELRCGADTYELKFTWNAAAEYESAMDGEPLSEALLLVAEKRLSARALRAMLWAGLRKNHPRVTILEAGEIIDEVGRSELLRVMGVALRYYFPELAAQDDGAPDPPPPAASA